MKTSIHVPQDLYDACTSLDPDIPFAELMRDALVLGLRQWREEVKAGPAVFKLQMQVRAAQSAADLAGAKVPYRGGRTRADRRRAAPPAPEPATPPAGRKAPAKRSGTTAQAPSSRQKPAAPKRARSPRS